MSIHLSLTSALVVGDWSASTPCRFISKERASSTSWVGGWVGPGAGLDDMEKLKFLALPGPLGRPARNQSLYLLRYHDSFIRVVNDF
jgi:hypothetical protein